MKSSLIKHFDSLNNSSKMGHAFLIANTSFSLIESELKKIFEKNIFNKKNMSNMLDIYIVKTETNIITKTQILELQKKVINTSQFNEKKIYIIDEAEKLNLSAANSLLKMLEEPPLNVYAFLITKNINKVIPTIKSRCQVIFISSSSENDITDDDDIIKTKELLSYLECTKGKVIANCPEIYKITKDRDELRKILETSILIYKDCLNFLLKREIEWYNISDDFISQIASKNDIEKISRKMICLSEVFSDIETNININLILDKIAIEFERC